MDRATRLDGLDGVRRASAATSVVKSAVALHGVTVLVPEADEPYDFAADAGGMVRVAVRVARRVTPGTARFETDPGGSAGVDAYGVYAPARDDCYLVPAGEATDGSMALRFEADAAGYALDRQLAAFRE